MLRASTVQHPSVLPNVRRGFDEEDRQDRSCGHVGLAFELIKGCKVRKSIIITSAKPGKFSDMVDCQLQATRTRSATQTLSFLALRLI